MRGLRGRPSVGVLRRSREALGQWDDEEGEAEGDGHLVGKRSFETVPDGLAKEMRVERIASLAEANRCR